MPPRRAASSACPTDPNDVTACAIGNTVEGAKQITGGEKWGRDGIGGAIWTPDTWMWLKGLFREGVPSLSSTAVARPSDQVLISQSSVPDMNWAQNCNPDQAYRYWGDPSFNLYGDNNMTCGPMGRTGESGKKAGVYPVSEGTRPSQFPEGTNVSVFTDGHAKAQKWKAMHSQTVTNGTVKYLKYASPDIP